MIMIIENKILTNLEYPKVLEEIAKYAITDLGRKEIVSLRPVKDIDVIKKESGFVSEAKNILIEQDLPPIDYLADLRESVNRCSVEGAVLNVKQIHDIIKLASVSRKVYQYLKVNASDSSIYSEYANGMFVDKVFEHTIGKIFSESGDIKDNASQKLQDIRRQIIDRSEQLRKSVNRILKRLSESLLVQEEYVTLRDGRIVVPIKSEHKRHVRGFIHSESSTGQTVYIEPEETLELNNEILSLSFAEKREIEKILRNITVKIGEVHSELNTSILIIGKLDAIFAKARYSTEIIGSFPSLDDEKPFEIIEGRHPILVRKLKRENTIPLDVKIDDQNILLITGPNAGGKTVVLKSVGLFALLVQSGIHIPADPDSNFRIFDNILLDIGDQQSIEDDLSTFSSHLSNTNKIVNSAGSKSLVLLDEIGTGTDPSEGAALATAVLIKLRDLGATVFATTHHGNLKIIANELSGFENASMLFDSNELKPTYKFSQGMPGSSYAFEVARRIGLHESVLEIATEYLDSKKNKVEDLLLELEKKSNDLKEKLDYFERENVRLKGLANLYSDKVQKLEKEKREILNKAKLEADNYLRDVNRKVESAIKNIRESQAEKSVIREEKKNIEEIKQKTKKLNQDIEQDTKPEYEKPLQVGDTAKIKGTETLGKILEIKDGNAVILSGSIKVRSKLNKLEYSSEKAVNRPARSLYNVSTQVESIRLDIRGRKPEEAEYEVVKYLDNAYSNSIESVEILHGKGTGALKRTVHEILDKHEAVKDYNYAKIEFGGEGITIVQLK